MSRHQHGGELIRQEYFGAVTHKKDKTEGYRRDFNMNEMHAEPPFPCDYATSRNGCYDSTAGSKRVFKSQTALK